FEVAHVHPHAGAGFALCAERQASIDSNIFELSICQVAIELVGLRIIGDKEIGPAILIEIEDSNAERFRAAVKNAAVGGDVFKCAVAAIVEEPAGVAAIRLWRAIGFLLAVETAEHIVFG